MSRADLLQLNRRVIQSIAEVIRTAAPDAVVILVTNQLDEMTMEMLRATGFPRERVPGMAGTLDSSRFRYALAARAGVPVADVEAMTLGSHGDEMAPIISRARIRGRAINDFLSADAIRDAVDDAVTGGGQVVALRKTGSAALAPAHATVELLDHMRGDRAGVVPASVLLQGESGRRRRGHPSKGLDLHSGVATSPSSGAALASSSSGTETPVEPQPTPLITRRRGEDLPPGHSSRP